jgi:hypothetical protein
MKRIYLFLATLWIIQGCIKNSQPSVPLEDTLTEEQLRNIEMEGVDTISKFQDALFSDGRNMSDWAKLHDSGFVYNFNLRTFAGDDQRDLFRMRMTEAGFELINRLLYPNFPNQYGLAYVFGSKSFSKPAIGSYPGCPCVICQEPLYGLDCSGMIYQMARASGIELVETATSGQSKVASWNQAFDKSMEFQGLEMRDTTLDPALFEAGDIIVAPLRHIGMVFQNLNSIEVLHSIGKPTNSCSKNSDINHGPVLARNPAKWVVETFGSKYQVLRVIQKNKNLITNGNFSLGNSGFSTDYVYCNSTNCLFPLADNGYSIANDASTKHNSFVGKDHTDGKGMFMIVNGAKPTFTVWKQSVNVSMNTIYNFDCWICTLYPQNIADIIVKVNGIQLGTEFSAPPSVGQWVKMSNNWNSGSSTSATIEIIGTKNIANGNDFGLDDISFK